MKRVLEIRVYTLKPGTGAEFLVLAVNKVLPTLKRWNIDVVAIEPSLETPDAFCLLRAYDSMAHLQQSEDAFYGSDEWRSGPREGILSRIETYSTVVLEMDEAVINAMRRA